MNYWIALIGLIILLINPTLQSFAQSSDDVIVFTTPSGVLVIEFFPEDAPKTVENFLKLADEGFYDNTIFHRVIKDFMIQGGDPLTKPGAYQSIDQWGTGDAGYKIEAEFNPIKHNRGIVSMARSAHPDSASSQFFIVHQDSNFLDEQYTAFGRIITQESFDTLDKIASLKTINDKPEDWGEAEILKTEIKNRSEISNILELGEPERVEQLGEILDGKYTSNELGFSATFPEDWVVQTPPGDAANTPNVAAVGPRVNEFNPTISIKAQESQGATLENEFEKIKNNLQEPIDRGDLEIVSEETTIINGIEANRLIARGFFPTSTEVLNILFNEVIIVRDDMVYKLTYANSEENYESVLPQFENTLNSITFLSVLPGESKTDENSSTTEGGGCLIATATYGSEFAPQIQQLRETRDNIILKTNSGRAFTESFNLVYYSFSPAVADLERQSPVFKESVKLLLTPLITSLSLLSLAEIDSEEEVLGYGISIILLNIGIYFLAPAIIIHKLKNSSRLNCKFKLEMIRNLNKNR